MREDLADILMRSNWLRLSFVALVLPLIFIFGTEVVGNGFNIEMSITIICIQLMFQFTGMFNIKKWFYFIHDQAANICFDCVLWIFIL